jgi:hypothetical protein
MTSAGTLLVVLLAAALAVSAVALLRSRDGLPWPAIMVASLTSAVCFTVGGGSGEDTSGPSIATVMGSVVGFLAVAAAIIALVPRRGIEGPPPRAALLMSVGGIVLGAVGLVLNQLTA